MKSTDGDLDETKMDLTTMLEEIWMELDQRWRTL